MKQQIMSAPSGDYYLLFRYRPRQRKKFFLRFCALAFAVPISMYTTAPILLRIT